MSAWFIVAQVMGVITIVFDFVTYQIKDQRQYLLVYSIGSVFWTLMFVMLGLDLAAAGSDMGFTSMVPPIIAAFFGAFRSIIFWWIFAKKTRKRKIIGKVVLYVALAIGVAAAIISIVQVDARIRWVPIVGMFAALSFIVGQYLPSKHYLRVFAVFYAVAMALTQTPLYILEGSMLWNPMGLVIEGAKVISIALFYGIFFYRKWLLKRLPLIKQTIAREVEKIQNKLPDAITPEKLEKLWAKMLRYELYCIDKSDLVSFSDAEKKTGAFLESLQGMQSVKDALLDLPLTTDN
ncbi:MAG: YgjV family protein [Firmicutes bacterium]|nr:YgjV family protein [Bacillota bacterium]